MILRWVGRIVWYGTVPLLIALWVTTPTGQKRRKKR